MIHPQYQSTIQCQPPAGTVMEITIIEIAQKESGMVS